MSLSDCQGHSSIASRFECDIWYCVAAVVKIATDKGRRAVPLQYLRFLLNTVSVEAGSRVSNGGLELAVERQEYG